MLAFPCDQFGGQEPGSHDDILEFVEKINPGLKDKITWFEKSHVNGRDAREVFAFLEQKIPGYDGMTSISWNFTKFLVDHEGKPYKRFSPKQNPIKFQDDILELLKKRESTTG